MLVEIWFLSQKVFTLHFKVSQAEDMCASLNCSYKSMVSTKTLGATCKAPLLLSPPKVAVVDLLLGMINIDPNVRDIQSDATPLLCACQMGHVSIVRHFYSLEMMSALLLAAYNGHAEINLRLDKDDIDVNLEETIAMM
jgi:ankyrin repeat protein